MISPPLLRRARPAGPGSPAGTGGPVAAGKPALHAIPDESARTRQGRVMDHLEVGSGPAVVIMQGYAMQPRTYLRLAKLLSSRCRVIVPSLFGGDGRWSSAQVVRDLSATLDALQLERVTMIGHSFGGGLQLNFAALHPDRVNEAVFVDTLAMSREWTLAAEALHPVHLLWMASPRAAVDFAHSWVTHPLRLAQAAWWGFTSDRREEVARLSASEFPKHVLWANRDSLLTRADGQRFARDMGADFKVVDGPGGAPVDHDWLYRHPDIAVRELQQVGLRVLEGS